MADETTAAMVTSVEVEPLATVLRHLAELEPHRPAITCGDETLTRAELEDRARQVADELRTSGVSTGDLVAIILPNGVDHFIATLATWKVGAVPSPISHRMPTHERVALLELANPAVVVGLDPTESGGRSSITIPGPSVQKQPPEMSEPEPLSPAMAAMASGGSTGRPKLILSGNGAFVYPMIPTDIMGMTQNGVTLTPGPLYHTAGFQWSWWALSIGCHVIVLPKFDPVDALDTIRDHKVDWMGLVPTMMSRLLRTFQAEPDRFDLSSVRKVWHGAAPCPPWLKEAWIDLIGADRLMEVYAATEGFCATMISGSEWLKHRGSVGRVTTDIVKILDPDGKELPSGEVGEIFATPPPGTPAFKYLGADVRSNGERVSVGDLGWLDDDDYLYISDRRVDLIVSGGANVFPAEVEAAILEHPKVRSAIVVGLPDPDLGQRVHAVVEADPGLDDQTLHVYLAERLVRYKIPRSIHLVDQPLRDEAGKARRSAIREQEILWSETSA
jgi:bile acid-coenzyme A ligase